MNYTGRLRGGPPMAAKFRLAVVHADTNFVAVMLPEGDDPVAYISREGEEKKPDPTPETHLIVPVPVAIFKRDGEFRPHKGGRRATFKFLEMQKQSFTSDDPEGNPDADQG